MKQKKSFILNKEFLKFYKSAKKEFKNVKNVDFDGEVLEGNYSGLCSYLYSEGDRFLTQDIEAQFIKVEVAIKNSLNKINSSKEYKKSSKEFGTYVLFPTNELRIQFIDDQINKYKKLVDKQKTV